MQRKTEKSPVPHHSLCDTNPALDVAASNGGDGLEVLKRANAIAEKVAGGSRS